jgi:hypothetical protein
MPTITQHLRRRLLTRVPERLPDLPELRRSERSSFFQLLSSNRMVMGAFRYGRLGAPDKPTYDRIPDMIRRLHDYQLDHNAEHLVDVANLCQLEFSEGGADLAARDDGPHSPML